MKVFVLELKQDDPIKCTAAKLVKFNLIQSIRFIPKGTIVLNPLSKIALSKTDNSIAKSLCAIDCSWNYFDETIKKYMLKEAVNDGRLSKPHVILKPVKLNLEERRIYDQTTSTIKGISLQLKVSNPLIV